MKKSLFCIAISLLLTTNGFAQQLAFPTAEGYGKYTVGGRGGVVFEVSNLKDTGEGSLRAAVEAKGPRTIVFKVSGTITLESALEIKNPFITIAGQTAPGDGITIRKYPLTVRADQVIIRYLRVRLGKETGRDDDAIGGRFVKNIIVDHVSSSWSVDEAMSFYHCDSLTVQWCIIAESLYDGGHASGFHGFGGICGSNFGTYHHNLIAHNSSRNLRIASGAGYFDYRNNVIYNWGYNSCYGGEQQQKSDEKYNTTIVNMAANFYKPGPATVSGEVKYRIAGPSYRDVKTDYGKWYIADNVMIGNSEVTNNNWNGGVQPDGGLEDISLIKLNAPWLSMSINQQTAEQAYVSVLENAGCSFPKHDVVDIRILSDTRNGIATCEGSVYKAKWARRLADNTIKCGMIDSPSDVGGWPELKSERAPTDTDHDGMPDEWETGKGLDPKNPADGNRIVSDGYTMLEKYLNSLSEK